MSINAVGRATGLPAFIPPPMQSRPTGLGDLPHVRTPVDRERPNGANIDAQVVADMVELVESQMPPVVLPDPPPPPVTAILEAHRQGRMIDVAA